MTGLSASPDVALVKRAVASADPNVLRITLLQLTGDEELATMPLESLPIRGGAGQMASMGEKEAAVVREKAEAFILAGVPGIRTDVPGEDELAFLLRNFSGEDLHGDELSYRREELAIEPDPFASHWTQERPAAAGDYSVAIIGAGLSGIAMGVQLVRLGVPFRIFERLSNLGGTWHINRYPDVRVDTSAFLYQFKFEHNYPWTEYYPRGSEVRDYLEHIARKHGVFNHIVFDADVDTGRFNNETGRWDLHVVDVKTGSEETVEASFVVSASGLFSTPNTLAVEGVDDFKGDILHSTAWDGRPLEGRRVAIVGNGSTGAQMLKKVASEAEHVYVVQRTPQWVAATPFYGDPIEEETRWLLDNLPFYWNWFSYSRVLPYLAMAASQTVDPEWQKQGGLISQRNDAVRANLVSYIEEQTGNDRYLVERLVPDYPPLARRLIIDNGFYTSLRRDNVDLVSGSIKRLLPDGVEMADGEVLPVDLIIAAVGFSTTKYVHPARYFGRSGDQLEDVWEKDGPRAYLGMEVPDFPNFFMMYGPNSQTRSSGLVAFVEQWGRYIASSIVMVIENGGKTVEVKPDVFQSYNDRLDAACEGIVWDQVPEGKNYYLNRFGRQQVSAPWLPPESYAMLRAPKRDDLLIDQT